MKTSFWIVLFGWFVSAPVLAGGPPGRDLGPLSGTYTFAFGDTDDDAVVSVRFSRDRSKYAPTDWLADGKMEDRVRRRTVTFSGALVSIDKAGAVVVDGQFVRFKLVGRRLEWLPAYEYHLLRGSPPSPTPASPARID